VYVLYRSTTGGVLDRNLLDRQRSRMREHALLGFLEGEQWRHAERIP
jgi:hypothetical protein